MRAFENNTSDRFLLNRMKNDDEVAFRALFDKYFIPLCRNASLFIRDQGIAEEVVLDVLTNLWDGRCRIEITSSVRLYLFRSVRNRSLNYLRDARYNFRLDDLDDYIPDKGDAEWLETEELDYFIQEAILSLPDRCREIFTDSRAKCKSHKEIAEEYGISVKTVETQITRAIKRIRTHLSDIYSLLIF